MGQLFQNLLTSPIKISEYITSEILLSWIKSLAIFTVVLLLAYYIFEFEMIIVHFVSMMFFSLIVLLTSTALALFLAGFIISKGREWASLSWTAINFILLFSGSFYSIEVFPPPIRVISNLIPYTFVFEGIRAMSFGTTFSNKLIIRGLLLSILYLLLSVKFFGFTINSAKKNGQLVKMF